MITENLTVTMLPGEKVKQTECIRGLALGPAPVHDTGIELSPRVINKKRLTYN